MAEVGDRRPQPEPERGVSAARQDHVERALRAAHERSLGEGRRMLETARPSSDCARAEALDDDARRHRAGPVAPAVRSREETRAAPPATAGAAPE